MISLRSQPLSTLVVALCAVFLWPPGSAEGKVFLTADEALDLAFPGCTVERRTEFLGEDDLEAARALAGVEIESGLVHPYRASCDGAAAGVAYFDTHRVRTLAETVMVVIDADGTVRRVEVVVFREPEEYIPRDLWYRQFDDQELDDDLHLKQSIRNVTGATLTARATTEAVRRVLAVHRVISERGAAGSDEIDEDAP